MFPDKFKNIFKKDIVVEYLTWNENESEKENNNQILEDIDGQNENLQNTESLEKNDEWMVENNWESEENTENWENNNIDWDEINEDWEDIDPNSLAWLLSDENWNETNVVDEEDSENNWLVNDENLDTENIWVDEEYFDPFSQIENVLNEEKSDYDKLNNYIDQWNYYKELWISENNKKMEKYWEYVVVTATEELWKLENWEEIDNSVFGRLDEILESLK